MAENTLITSRNVDVIFCIDGTGSMGSCIDKVKVNAKKFKDDLVEQLTLNHNSSIDGLNIKIIEFRDLSDPRDGDSAMVASEWFDLMAGDTDAYEKHLAGIVPMGGGDLPESGLEALFFAMTSDWQSCGGKDRQIIVLFTDYDAKDIGTGDMKINGKPTQMVDYDGLIGTWCGVIPPFISQSDYMLRQKIQRLIMFAPPGTKYEELSKTLPRSQFKATAFNEGLGEIDFGEIIKVIAASIATI